MAIFTQFLLDLHDELIVDLFAGGGGASLGIEMATGRQVDVAVNHDEAAVALHRMNHPQTVHHTSDVFEVDPHDVTHGRPVGLLWASPDCTFHSKARGGKPIRSKEEKRRALAWVVTRWAGQVRPRTIFLENVEEFADWGPLVARRCKETGRVKRKDGTVAEPGERVPVEDQQLVPCKDRGGARFDAWIRSLERHGYDVEWRELRACDYGAPTIRKRLFLIARCDGEPIVWPEPTHGEGLGLQPYRTAAECIDWTEPMCSIFATREEAREWGRAHEGKGTPVRPLAENTMKRIARGVWKYVIQNPEPFIVGVGGRAGQSPERSLRQPYQTITAKGDAALVSPIVVPNNANNAPHSPEDPVPTVTGGGRNMLVAPYLVPRYGEREGQAPRAIDIDRPSPAVVPTGNGAMLAAAFLAKHFTGVDGVELDRPAPTVTTIDHNGLVAASLLRYQTGDRTQPARAIDEPAGSVLANGGNAALVYAFLTKFYQQGTGAELDDPAPTVTTKDRMGLVTVDVAGEPFVIVDIAMRMLQPRELYRAQGFPDSYVIDRGADGDRLTKTEQVRMVGNSVCPPLAAALVRANVPEMVARDEVAA